MSLDHRDLVSASRKTLLASETQRPDLRAGGRISTGLIPPVWRLSMKDQHDAHPRLEAARHAAAGQVPHGYWKRLTLLAGLRHDRIVAPCVIDGPINRLSFAAWVSQFLAPMLSRGDIVIADNFGSHKGKPVRAALTPRRRRQAVLPGSLQPRPEPDRRGLRKTPDPAAQGRRAIREGHLAQDRQLARRFHLRGMRRLPPSCRICFRHGLTTLGTTRHNSLTVSCQDPKNHPRTHYGTLFHRHEYP
jgi:hypothetical protein